MEPALSVTSAQLDAWLVAFLWPFIRMLAVVGTAPVTGERSVPRTVKLALAGLLTVVVGPLLGPMPAVPVLSGEGLWVAAQQVLVGVAIGFSMRLVFTVVQAAGEYVGLQMGLSFAAFFDPSAGGSTMVLSRLLHALALLVFLAVDGHLQVITLLVHSFQLLPVSAAPLSARGWMVLVSHGGQIVAGALMLALPLVIALLVLNLAMGILNRVSPQVSIFSVGFPVTLLAGLVLLQASMLHLAPFLEPQFAAAVERTLEMLQALK